MVSNVACRPQCQVPSPHDALAGVKLPEMPEPCSPTQGLAVTPMEYPTPREQAYRQLKRFYSQRPSSKTAAGEATYQAAVLADQVQVPR